MLDPDPHLVAFIVTFFVLAVLRVITVFINIRRAIPPQSASAPCRTMVVLGSGGHTAEMLTLIAGLDRARYAPLVFVAAQGDTNSLQRIEQFEVRFQWSPHILKRILTNDRMVSPHILNMPPLHQNQDAAMRTHRPSLLLFRAAALSVNRG